MRIGLGFGLGYTPMVFKTHTPETISVFSSGFWRFDGIWNNSDRFKI